MTFNNSHRYYLFGNKYKEEDYLLSDNDVDYLIKQGIELVEQGFTADLYDKLKDKQVCINKIVERTLKKVKN